MARALIMSHFSYISDNVSALHANLNVDVKVHLFIPILHHKSCTQARLSCRSDHAGTSAGSRGGSDRRSEGDDRSMPSNGNLRENRALSGVVSEGLGQRMCKRRDP